MMTSLLDNCFQLQIWICCDFNLLRKPGFSNLPRQLQRIETCGPLSSFHWHADLLVFHQPPPPLYLKKTGNNSSQNLTTKFYVSNVASSLPIRKQKPIKRLLSVNKHLLEVDVCSINWIYAECVEQNYLPSHFDNLRNDQPSISFAAEPLKDLNSPVKLLTISKH